MQSGDLSPKKISRIRTFQNDISSVRPNTTKSPSPSVEEVPVIETSDKEKISTATIFRPPTTTDIPVVKPQIPENKITETPEIPPVAITEKSIPETPLKEPVIPSFLKQPIAVSEKKPLDPILPKEALSAIVNNDISEVVSDDTSAEGSVITDQKRTRFSLTSSIVEAVRAWFVDEKESIKYRAETKRKAIPTVRPVEKRKEILQKAAEQSAMAPRDDHMQLATKFALPKTKAKEADASIQIKKKAEPEKPSWSHYTDKQTELAPKEEAAPSVPASEKVVPQTKKIFLPPLQVAETAIDSKSIAPLPAEVVETKSTTEPNIAAAVESKPPAVKVVGIKNKTTFKGFGKFFTYAGVAVVVIVAITSGVGLVWWLFSNVNQSPTLNLAEENVPVVPPELVSYEDNINITLPLRKGDLWQSILSVEARAGSDLVLVSLMNLDNTPATASNILTTINWPSNSAFSRNIEEINFGRYRGVTFIVIRATNFDSVFGGLLAAESTMAEDLDIFIEDNTEALADNFVDELIQNHDIRVLKKESGSDALVYGFVNRNTIIITSDRNTFSEVANQVR